MLWAARGVKLTRFGLTEGLLRRVIFRGIKRRFPSLDRVRLPQIGLADWGFRIGPVWHRFSPKEALVPRKCPLNRRQMDAVDANRRYYTPSRV